MIAASSLRDFLLVSAACKFLPPLALTPLQHVHRILPSSFGGLVWSTGEEYSCVLSFRYGRCTFEDRASWRHGRRYLVVLQGAWGV